MAILAIYTNSFPYGKAETFLDSEIKYLSSHFEAIIIVPFSGKGDIRMVPNNVRVVTPIQERNWPRIKIYLTGLISYRTIYKIPELKNELKNFTVFECLKYIGFAILTKRNLSKKLPVRSSIHYSYWLGFSAFCLTMLKMEGKIKTIVSRAHGYDLYEERGEKGLTFIKTATIKNLDRLFFISEHGLNYLLKKHPEYSDKYSLSRLGTSDPGFINPSPDKRSLTLVSCSAINPNKRIHLILESLILIKLKFSFINVKWYHLGNGIDLEMYIRMTDIYFKDSLVQCFFTGQMSNFEIFDFYKSVPVDIFVNVSANEGIPVSIMEAQSFSIPVAATNVGGISEIVNDENGQLLSPELEPEELADIFHRVFEQKAIWEKKRSRSRIYWENNYNAAKNYSAFSQDLLDIIDT